MAEMGGLAERQIAEAIEALTTRDSARAWRVIKADATIDNMQRAIEERAIETIARRQPVAVDLRQVVGILRIANELERIGDLAKNISKRIIAINGEDMPRRSLRGVSHMANLMLAQLRDVLDSFARRDAAKAVDVWTRDQDVDRLYTSLFRELLVHMMENPDHGDLRDSPAVLHQEPRAHGRSCDQYRGGRLLHGERPFAVARAAEGRRHQHAHRGHGAKPEPSLSQA